ncbi:MAG: hypothetical protein ACRDH2_20215, partial [Anaerolineales bacterium]
MIVRQRSGKSLGENETSVEAARPPAPSSPAWLSADLQENLQAILEQLGRLVDCDAWALMLLTGDTLSIAASQGLPDSIETDKLSFKLSEHPYLGDLLRESQPVVMGSGLVETRLND